MDFYGELLNIVGKDRVLRDEPLRLHTTLKIGGPADYFVKPESEDELCAILELCRKNGMPRFLLGNGSNLLVSDSGYRGVVIKLWKTAEPVRVLKKGETSMNPKRQIECKQSEECGAEFCGEDFGTVVQIAGGTMLSRAAMAIANMGLQGFEFAAGIPGTLGGAVVMNAGAYGSEIKDCIVSARVMDGNGSVKELSKEELKLGYRTSAIQGTELIVLDACFVFQSGKKEDILSEIEELNQRRRDKQPLEYPSAGSTFKRPEGYFAGKLIMEAGLAGYRVGDAEISRKHCGFAINAGEATAVDFYRLMQDVATKVKEQSGVILEPEVRMLGDFPA